MKLRRRAMLHATLAAMTTAQGQPAHDTKGGAALPRATAAFHAGATADAEVVAEMYEPSVYNDPGLRFFPNHSPKVHIDESVILVGVRTLAHLTLDCMLAAGAAGR